MPKNKAKPTRAVQNPSPPSHGKTSAINYIKQYANKDFITKMLSDSKYLNVTCWGLIIVELIINVLIIHKVRYTEIDWIAYMQEVEGFLNGTLDYKQLKGDTGPLVYPAGFVYIYSVFYFLTSNGKNIFLAQYIFLAIYILQLYFVFKIHVKTAKVPPYALIISTMTSYRIHSIYVLRLFNDPIAVLLFYISLNAFLSNKWLLGSIFYSLAVSVKMNILLYAPCLLGAYLTNLSYLQTLTNLFVCGFIQLILGTPFLFSNPLAYIQGSFDLGRIFEHKWTVNYRFLSRETFENRTFHIALLLMHVTLLLTFLPLLKRYLQSYAKLNYVTNELKNSFKRKTKNNKNKNEKKATEMEEYSINFNRNSQLLVLPFFVTNLIGIICARSLHYQFYSWYFHSLIYLVFCTNYQKPVIFLMLAIIEFCWNTYPSTDLSSVMLHFCHAVLLFGIYKYMKK